MVLILPERLDESGTDEQAAVTGETGETMAVQWSGRNEEAVSDKDGERRRLAGSSTKNEGATTGLRLGNVFLAHSMILGSRSEKFAAMLRFVRRQGAASSVASDVSSTESDASENEDRSIGESEVWGTGDAGADDGQSSSRDGVEQQDNSYRSGDEDGDLDEGHKDGQVPSRLQRSCRRSSGQCFDSRPCRCRVRRDPAPREMELQSPLLSPRSLGLFLEFLYTGVLLPSLSTRELSELALIADEYLVPDLTRQAETLLVECLVRFCVRLRS